MGKKIKMSISSKAKFVSFEGIDGCGKSTQANILIDTLNHNSFKTKHVREPGGTPISEEIRSVLLNNKNLSMANRAEALLMCASRSQLTKDVIMPSLKSGYWVVADRYADSTLAYQGGGRNLDNKWLIELNRMATYDIKPDLTFLIDIDVDEANKRMKKNSTDRIESVGVDFQSRIRTKYLELAENYSDRYVVINGKLSIDDISKRVIKELLDRFNIELY